MATALRTLVQPSRSAVIVVDVQNDFCEPAGVAGRNGLDTGPALAMVARLQAFLTAARAAGTAVVFVQTIHEVATNSSVWVGRKKGRTTQPCAKGSWGADFTLVAPRDGEPVVIKHRYNGFLGTRLESVLHTLEIENVLMTGVATAGCVDATARHAFMLDYNVVFVSDCVAGYDPESDALTIASHAKYYGPVATSTEIADAWSVVPAVA
jgi:ureidoacrylate peracid hydrolase